MPYTPGLDGLRALAIALVLLFHAGMPGLPGANLGVDLFLVLSGYLITRLLLGELAATGGIQLQAFYLRRLWRLMPPLVLMLTLYAALAPFAWPEYPFHARDIAALLLYLGNIAIVFGSSPDKLMHGWSLGLEEQFYLIWPLLMLLLWRCFKGRAAAMLLLLYGAVSVWRWWIVQQGDPTGSAYYRPDLHSTGLILGGALAVGGWRFGQRAALLGFALLALAVVWPQSGDEHLQYFVPLAEWAAALLLVSIMRGDAAPLWHPLAVQVGKLSYGVYLFHYPIMKYLTEHSLPWYWVLLLGSLASYALAWLSYHSIERYARERRLRYAVRL